MLRSRAEFFVAISRISARLPAFRGRTRIFLFLFDVLGLDGAHVEVRTRLRGKVPFEAWLDLHSWLQRIAYLTGGYEADTTEFLLRLGASVRREGYLLDIGANVGLLAIPYAMAIERSSSDVRKPVVIAVEAVAANVDALRRNVALNAADNFIEVLDTALGDVEKDVEMQIEGDLHAGEGTGTANILPDHSTYECVRVPLHLSTLDRLMDSQLLPAGCSIVKTDTDGYDLKIMHGGRRFLANSRPVIFGEFSAHCLKWHEQSIGDIRQFAHELDYLVWKRIGSSWAFSPDFDDATFVQDLLLVPSESADVFSWCLAPRQSVIAPTGVTAGISG